ncbi:hypothetical protein KHS38_14560 [Mucilaginibacter sp. Bleaf8]|uniref:hypothetical protein n=1 Tax=Mucilaginibacter sp. Bleaf8 TaxID=2834430 RepID=UPI001BCFC1F2|nr:hypothetical protein [Mucilaginibacter sp. Bleaf8]MBS7565631.1 hypothetical protein [Mucilaginibacter sp. Bleaf8]
MKKQFLLAFSLIILAFFTAHKTYSQARSSIGIGGGINYPLQSGYHIGRDKVIQGNIRLKDALTLMPTIGLENIESDKKGVYNGYYFVGSGRSVDLVFLNVAARYYFYKRFFAFAGPSIYLGGDDAGSSGLGGTLGGGYDWAVDHYSSLEFSLRADVMPVYDKTVPVSGLRVVYKFNFSRRY